MPTAKRASEYTFTVFTSTRNRAHTLERPFRSLQAQTFRDFEWLIIDNGSTDGTADLIERFKDEAEFPIRYVWQEDAGKHGSLNRGMELAEGELFLILDSDDGCVPTALERLKFNWETIPIEDRSQFTGVTVLCNDQDGRLVGTPFPHDPTDSDSREIRYRYKVQGEKWGFHRTEVLREHRFPTTPGYTGLVIPSTVWGEIARAYKTRYVNERLHIYWQDQEVSLSRPRRPLDDAYGVLLESQSILNHDMRFFRDAPKALAVKAIMYVRSSFHTGRGPRGQAAGLTDRGGLVLWATMLPAGWLFYELERLGLWGPIRRVRTLLG